MLWCQARSGRTSMNSITPSRALRTRGVSVFTTMFGAAGIAHEATGFGAFATYPQQEHTAHSSICFSCLCTTLLAVCGTTLF